MSKAHKSEAGQSASSAASVDIATILGAHADEFEAIRHEMEGLAEAEAKEVVVIHQKYKALVRPIFEKRFAIFQKIPQFWYNIVCSLKSLTQPVDKQPA